ncbi:MAG: hypothetical protein QM741_04775 [Rudaea sp.]|uniref:hypothetical protein n=1 Tax=Rudaea sp. TaxID=2136325 RepID=UPI0039E539D6
MSLELFDNIPHNQLGFWANETLKSEKVADFLDLDKADFSKIANIPVRDVRYDEHIPTILKKHMEQIAIICGLVADFFGGDAHKTALWFKTKNPMLGELSPRDMLRYGRMEKLRQIVMDARRENGMGDPEVKVQVVHGASQTKQAASAH